MITFFRTADVAPGQVGAAIEFAKKMQVYFKEAHGIELEVMVPFGGNPLRIAWLGRFPDMTALDALHQRVLGDQQYWNVVNEYQDAFLPGSIDDQIWRAI
jgi:hypothetical protein